MEERRRRVDESNRNAQTHMGMILCDKNKNKIKKDSESFTLGTTTASYDKHDNFASRSHHCIGIRMAKVRTYVRAS